MHIQPSLTEPSLISMVRDALDEPIVAWSSGEVTRGSLRACIARCKDAEMAAALCSLLEGAHPYAHGTVVHAFFRALSMRAIPRHAAHLQDDDDLLGHAMDLIPTTLSRSERAVTRQKLVFSR